MPVLFLSGWVQQSALQKEIDAVQEKHLLVAQNLTGELERYVSDLESAFRLIAQNLANNNRVLGLPSLLHSLDFRYLLVSDSNARIIKSTASVNDNNHSGYLPEALSDRIKKIVLPLLKKSRQQPDEVLFSNLIKDENNQTTFLLFKYISTNRYVIGSISTQYIRDVQQAVAFGRRGHAAIVDKTGRAIAHPIKKWAETMKDMSFLPPVKQMMSGNTGVSQFYTPAMKADMIAGYSVIPKVGWGVMIPQPFEELKERAHDVQNIALAITALGIAIAGLLGWFFACKLSTPIKSVINSTHNLQQGRPLQKVRLNFKFIPSEILKLITSFNQMAVEIKRKSSYLEKTSTRLAEAQRIARVGNWELDLENDNLWCSNEFFRICDIKMKFFKDNYQGLVKLVHPDDKHLFEDAFKRARRQGGRFKIDHRIILPDGTIVFVHHEGEMLTNTKTGKQNMIGIIHDRTENHEYEAKLFHQANYDALTDLPNRTLLMDRLKQEILASERTSDSIGLLSIDLDNFKLINDSHGHIIGDKLIKQAATRIASCLRKSDTLSRLSGDEFTVILRNITREHNCSVVANKIIKSLHLPFQIDDIKAFIGASIGITLYPNDATDPVTLLRNADIALYRAKEAGKNDYCFFKQEMDQEISNRVKLTNDLRKAVDNEELEIYYQPIIDLQTGAIKSAEALVRWQHTEHGFVPPIEFIPIAEESGIIGPLGLHVLNKACTDATSWINMVENAPAISVNLSVKQLQLGLSKNIICDIIKKSQLPPNHLTFEITESMVMNDIDEAINWMLAIKDLGVSFSIDDFGTGYSSLSYLKRLPVDNLKIDRTFIKDVLSKPEDAALVESIIAIGENLNMKIVAEGAEQKEQVDYLAKINCGFVQGYYFSKPIPADEFAILLKNWEPQSFPKSA